MSKNQKTRNQFCTEMSLVTWKFTSAWNMDKQAQKTIASKMSNLKL